jgi:hypothetical protein
MRLIRIVVAVVVCACGFRAQASLVGVSAAGATPASISGTVAAFQSSIGGGTVAGANGSFGGLRREINWDGVPDNFADPNPLPANFFNVNSPRGAVFSTAGTGFLVSADSANPTSTPVLFTDLNASYAGVFQAFSPERIFGVTGATDMDVNFFLPGTNTPSSVKAFGVVFVDNTQSTFPGCASIQVFNGATSLGFFCAPAAPAGGLSFLGLSGNAGETFTSVRLHLGTGLLGTTQSSTNEVVVMDDFIFAEPGGGVPEPATWALTMIALTGAVLRRRFSR